MAKQSTTSNYLEWNFPDIPAAVKNQLEVDREHLAQDEAYICQK